MYNYGNPLLPSKKIWETKTSVTRHPPCFKENSNRPLEHTPDPQVPVYEANPFNFAFRGTVCSRGLRIFFFKRLRNPKHPVIPPQLNRAFRFHVWGVRSSHTEPHKIYGRLLGRSSQ